MKLNKIVLVIFVAAASAACSPPKLPPGWPSGAERPINPPHLTRPAK